MESTAPAELRLRYPRLPDDLQGLPATMASASVAGLLSRVLIHPLDTAKAVIQVQTTPHSHSLRMLGGSSRTLRTLSYLWHMDGAAALYRGFA